MTGGNNGVKMIKVSDDIILKQIESSDTSDIYETIDAQRDYLGQWLPFIHYTLDIEDSEHVVITMINVTNLVKEHSFVIKYKGKFAGLIGFRNFDKTNKKIDLGYWLSKNFQKKGIVFNSVLALMEYAFEDLLVNKICIRCPVGNDQSCNIPKRIGYFLEGIERAGELLPDNSYIDLEVYGMLKSDYYQFKY